MVPFSNMAPIRKLKDDDKNLQQKRKKIMLKLVDK